MDNKRKPLDYFFKSSLSEMELDRKGNWELMQHLIEEQEKKKKKRRILWLCLFTGAVMISGTWYFIAQHSSTPVASIQESSTPIKSNPSSNFRATIPSQPQTSVQSSRREKIIDPVKFETKLFHNPHAYHSASIPAVPSIDVPAHTSAGTPKQPIYLTSDSTRVSYEENISQAKASEIPVSNSSTSDNLILSEPVEVPAITQTVTDSLIVQRTQKDSAVIDTSHSSTTDSLPKSPSDLHSNVIVSIGATGYQTGISSLGIAPVIGFGYIKTLNGCFAAEVSVLYAVQNGYDLTDSQVQTVATYFLDKEETEYGESIQITRLHKLYIPFTLYYSLNMKNSILAAVQLSLLINTQGDFTETHTVGGTSTLHSKSNVYGYMDGIRNTNYLLSLGYHRVLTNVIGLQARISRDFLNSFDTAIFPNVSHRPLYSAQLYLVLKF